MYPAGLPEKTGPSNDKVSDLWLKVLALGNSRSDTVVVVSMDLYGVSRNTCDRIRLRLLDEHRLPPDNVLLVSTRTLSGPLTRGVLPDLHPEDPKEKERIEEYTDALENTLVAMVGEALAKMEPTHLWRSEGYLAPSRDKPIEAARDAQTWRPPSAMPVLVVRALDERIVALLFSQSIRGSNLSLPGWSGDLEGEAEARIEDLSPGMLAIPVGACSAEVAIEGRVALPASAPAPPPSLEEVERWGSDIAMTVRDVLQGPMRPVTGGIRTSSIVAAIPYDALPPTKTLQDWKQTEGWRSRWAARTLALGKSEPWRPPPYSITIRAWALGDLLWIQFPGDAPVGYSDALKKRLGHEVWITARADECLGTLPVPVPLRGKDARGIVSLEDLGLSGHVGDAWASGADEALIEKAAKLAESLR